MYLVCWKCCHNFLIVLIITLKNKQDTLGRLKAEYPAYANYCNIAKVQKKKFKFSSYKYQGVTKILKQGAGES